MANGTDEKKWKRVIEQQKEEMEEITESFKEFFEKHQDVTADELKNFIKTQAQQAESGKVSSDLMKRVEAIEKMPEADQLTGDDLKEELDKTSEKFHDDLNILSETVTKGNEMLSSGFSQMTGVLRESFGPVFDLFDQSWSILSGIYSTMLGAFRYIKIIPTLFSSLKAWFMRPNREEKQQTEHLSSMNNYFKRKEKREMREVAGGGWFGKIVKALEVAVFGIAAVLGGIAGALFLPFKLIIKAISSVWNLIKDTKLLQLVSSGLGKIKGVFSFITSTFTKLFPTVAKVTGKISGIFGKILGTFGKVANVVSKLPIISSMLQGLVKGLTKLAWPIQAIFSVVSFIKGFMGTKGDIINKIKGGLTAVVKQFITLPVKLLGWITDWVLELFGVEIEGGAAKKVMGKLMAATKLIIDWMMWPITAVMDLVKGFSSTEGSFVDKIKGGLHKAITGVLSIPVKAISWIIDSIAGLFGMEVDSAKTMMKWISTGVTKALSVILFPFKMIYQGIKLLISLVKGIDAKFGLFEDIGNIAKSVFDVILFPFKAIWSGLKILWNLFTGNLQGAIGEIKELFSSVIDVAKSLFSGIVSFLKWSTPIGWLYMGFKSLWDFFASRDGSDGGIFDTLMSLASKLFRSIGGFIMKYTPIGWVYSGIKDLYSFFTKNRGEGESIIGYIIDMVKELPGKIADFFKNLVPSWDSIKSGIAEVAQFDLTGWFVDKIGNLASSIKDWIMNLIPSVDDMKGMVEGAISWIPGIGDDNKGTPPPGTNIGTPVPGGQEGAAVTKGGLVYTHPAEIIVPQDLSKKLLKIIDNQDTDSIGKYESEKIQLYRQMRDYLGNMIEIYREQTNIMRNQQNNEQNETRANPSTGTEPPDEIESMGLLLFNKSWGMG